MGLIESSLSAWVSRVHLLKKTVSVLAAGKDSATYNLSATIPRSSSTNFTVAVASTMATCQPKAAVQTFAANFGFGMGAWFCETLMLGS